MAALRGRIRCGGAAPMRAMIVSAVLLSIAAAGVNSDDVECPLKQLVWTTTPVVRVFERGEGEETKPTVDGSHAFPLTTRAGITSCTPSDLVILRALSYLGGS